MVRFELTPFQARGFADRGLKPLDYICIWRRTEVSIPIPLTEYSQFSRLVCGPPQFIRQIIGALDRTRTYNIYHLKVARLPNCATRAYNNREYHSLLCILYGRALHLQALTHPFPTYYLVLAMGFEPIPY